MKCNNLINIISDYNDFNLIASIKLNPDKIILVHSNTLEEREIFIDIKEVLEEKLPNSKIIERIINLEDMSTIEDVVKDYSSEETIINTSGGSKLLGILFNNFALKYNTPTMIIDMDKRKIYKINNNLIEDITDKFIELNIEDFIASTGGGIISQSTKIYMDTQIQKLLDYFITHYSMWQRVRDILKNNMYVKVSELNPSKITIRTFGMIKKNREDLNKVISKLRELKLAEIKYVGNYDIVLNFKNRNVKSFLLVSGSWLEALTYKAVSDIRGVDDVKGGVVFLWDEDIRYVKNELDVIATYDSRLICISCKDTPKYDEDTLNELEVYAKQLGGEEAIRILVSTHESYKRSIESRANEMDIHIVIFDGNIQKFNNKLRRIINE